MPSYGKRRRYGSSRTSGPVKPPKPPSLPKQAKPEIKDLAAAYKKYVNGSTTARVQALHEALAWWDVAIPYFLSKKPMELAQLKSYERANKARALGIGGVTEGEQESGLRTTINLYEKIWGGDTSVVPSFQPFLDKYNQQKKELEAKEEALKAKYNSLLESLNGAYAEVGIKFAVQKSSVARQIDGRNLVLISQDLAKVLADRMKSEGLLSALLSEATTVVKVVSIEQDDQGRHSLNVQKMVQQLPVVLTNILRYCETVPRNKVFKSAPEVLEANVSQTGNTKHAPKIQVPKIPRDPNAPKKSFGGRGGGPKVGGRYIPGSAMATLYERLQDEQQKTLKDIFQGLTVGNPADRLKWLIRHGADSGKWSITVSGDKVQMRVLS